MLIRTVFSPKDLIVFSDDDPAFVTQVKIVLCGASCKVLYRLSNDTTWDEDDLIDAVDREIDNFCCSYVECNEQYSGKYDYEIILLDTEGTLYSSFWLNNKVVFSDFINPYAKLSMVGRRLVPCKVGSAVESASVVYRQFCDDSIEFNLDVIQAGGKVVTLVPMFSNLTPEVVSIKTLLNSDFIIETKNAIYKGNSFQEVIMCTEQ